MTLPQREHPAARAELRAAANWYDNPETGQELLNATLEARRDIAESPESWPTVRGWDREPHLRRKSVAGFPYGVIYFVTSEEVVIVAYAHEKRRPGYWERRLRD